MSTVSAAQAVGEYLQSPDDLLKVSAFRKKLAKEKASIDAKLKSGVKDQLEATREGLRRLLGTRNNVQAIKDEIISVETMCRDPQNEVKTFDQISRVCPLPFSPFSVPHTRNEITCPSPFFFSHCRNVSCG